MKKYTLHQGMRTPWTTIWITGLPASGKSTIAQAVASVLTSKGLAFEILDGEDARIRLSPDLGFSQEDRMLHVARLAGEARRICEGGSVAIVAAISPYRVARDAARRTIGGRFIEVYVRCPLDVCRRRDPKGLYRRASSGEIGQVTGINDPYEPPEMPEAVVDTDRETPEQGATRIMSALL